MNKLWSVKFVCLYNINSYWIIRYDDEFFFSSVLWFNDIVTFEEENKSKYICWKTKLILIQTSNAYNEFHEKIIKSCKINWRDYKILLAYKWLTTNEFTVVLIEDDGNLNAMLNLYNDVRLMKLFVEKEL